MRRRVTDVLIGVGLIGVYVLAARIGLSFDAAAGFASLVWPPAGISLAALLLLGPRFWPSIFIGAVIANVLTGAPMIVALSIGVLIAYRNTTREQASARTSEWVENALRTSAMIIMVVGLGGALSQILRQTPAVDAMAGGYCRQHWWPARAGVDLPAFPLAPAPRGRHHGLSPRTGDRRGLRRPD